MATPAPLFFNVRDFVPRWSDCYAVRISYGVDRLIPEFWLSLQDFCYAVFATEHHDAERKHVHLAIYNSRLTHDRLRKKITQTIIEWVDPTPPTGNALMSVKKWNGDDTYLVYMLKGTRYKIVANNYAQEAYGAFLCLDYIDELKAKWIENMSKAAGYYNEFKASVFWLPPQETIIFIHDGEPMRRTQPITLETVKQAAVQFSLAYLKVTAVDGKVRFIAKDIVSNYCLFNNIKMGPIYI